MIIVYCNPKIHFNYTCKAGIILVVRINLFTGFVYFLYYTIISLEVRFIMAADDGTVWVSVSTIRSRSSAE